jgi:amino acid adenylation domain-containing protein
METGVSERGSTAASLTASIPRRARPEVAPLSFAQSRWWFLNQLEPDTASLHNWTRATRWLGPLDVETLERSLAEVIRRHEALRTRFTAVEGSAVQEAAPLVSFQLPLVDLTSLPEGRREEEARRLALAEFRKPIDLTGGLLLRATLLRLTVEEHILVLVIHHITSDGWSMQILHRELTALYSAFMNGHAAPLAALPIQYGDYAAWQREYFQGEVLERELAYWRERLSGAPALLELPTDRPRSAVQTYPGAQISTTLPPSLITGLATLGRRERSSLFMVLLAAFKALLFRYSGQTDLVVGVPIAGRVRVELESLIGALANALVLRTDVSGDPSFRELLQRTREVALGAYAHQELPFEKLVEELHPDRSARHHPLFQVMFNFRDFSPGTRELAGLRLEEVRVERGTALFDLSMALVRAPDGVGCGISYNTDLFDAATIERLAAHYRRLLEHVVSEPDRRLSELPLWTEAERRQVLVEWNATAQADPGERCIHELFELQAARTPDSVAVVCDGRQLTYHELNRQANQLAHHLQKLGVGPEVRVGLCLERSLEMVVGLLGVLKAGGAYVPLDPGYPRERLAFMVEDARAPILLTHQGLLESLSDYPGRVIRLDEDGQALAGEPAENPATRVHSDNLAYVMYTSGSTGRPKGVMICHRAVVNHLRWRDAYFPLSPADRGLQKASLSFDDSVWEVFEPLLAGARLILARPGGQADSAYLVQLIAEQQITTACFVPSLLRAFLEESDIDRCGSLRRVTTGGEALGLDLQAAFFSRLGADLHNGYGPTEATISASFWTCERGSRRATVPIGRPIANTRLYVLDARLQPVPVGASGELCIGGLGLARGYLARPGFTAERFIPDPFCETPGERLYRSGDRARFLPDGTLEFLGRLDDQVKVRGYRIELGEIESAMSQHPAVRECVAQVHEDAPGERRLVAYVVAHPPDGSTGPAVTKALQTEQIAHWQARYEELYGRGPLPSDPAFNTVGWISSFTEQPIPSAEMREWLMHTVERIQRTRPRRVLEIGCGTGMLMFRVAPQCEQYVGTDFSSAVLDWLHPQVDAAGLADKVTLLPRDAADFSDFAPDSFDLVILNSVAQYFPGVDHFMRVLEGAVATVAPGGSVFLGDIRNFELLEAFHTSIELYRTPASLRAERLRERVRGRLKAESELTLAPSFFAALPLHLPKVGWVEIEPKRGRATNELTRFRYDVTLHLGPRRPSSVAAQGSSSLDWEGRGLSIEQLRRMLFARPPELHLTRIPNARVRADVLAVELLAGSPPPTVGALREALKSAGESAPTPEDFWALAEETGYKVDVSWAGCDAEGRYDVWLRRQDAGAATGSAPAWPSAEPMLPWTHYANQPLARKVLRNLVPELRSHLRERLPDYMVPQAFVFLDQLPLTPSGKVDRRALPAPEQSRPAQAETYVAPATRVEEVIAGIWAAVLKLERIGTHDNFFELGGHSLLATQVISRIRQQFQVNLPLRALFEAPTVAALALALNRDEAESGSDEAERLLGELDQISEQEAERLLAHSREHGG